MLRVVTDLHHSVLYESLALLFIDRAILGPAEIIVWKDGHYQTRPGPAQEEFGRVPVVADSLDRADIVIATVSGTRRPFQTLARGLKALYVDHIGNAWDAPIGETVLWASAHPRQGVTYHPEFHRVPWVPPTGERVASFHASFVHSPCRESWDLVAKPGWVIYGTEQDPLRPHQVAQARSDCLAIWHCKDADGYGFGVHEAFASGRAVIGHRAHYEGKLAEPLFIRGETYREPGEPLDDLADMGRRAKARFDALVDFDEEALLVRDYLSSRL